MTGAGTARSFSATCAVCVSLSGRISGFLMQLMAQHMVCNLNGSA